MFVCFVPFTYFYGVRSGVCALQADVKLAGISMAVIQVQHFQPTHLVRESFAKSNRDYFRSYVPYTPHTEYRITMSTRLWSFSDPVFFLKI
jgi:hypothetical protein